MARRRHNLRPGFNLIELAMVVAIVSVVTGLAVPRLTQSGAQRRANLAATKFEADVDRLLRGARSQGEERVLSQHATKTHYIVRVADGTLETVDLSAAPYGVSNITFALDDSSTTLTATSEGMLESGGTVRFHVDGAYTDVKLTGIRTASLDDPGATLGFTIDAGVASASASLGTAGLGGGSDAGSGSGTDTSALTSGGDAASSSSSGSSGGWGGWGSWWD